VGCSSGTEDCTGKWVDGGSEEKLGRENDLLQLEPITFFINSNLKQIEKGYARNGLTDLPENFMLLPFVEKQYFEFLKNNYGIDDPDPKVISAFNSIEKVNILGYNMVLKVPGNKSINSRSAEKPTCNCSSGSSGCTLKEIKKYGVVIGYQCEAGTCVTCNITIPQQ